MKGKNKVSDWNASFFILYFTWLRMARSEHAKRARLLGCASVSSVQYAQCTVCAVYSMRSVQYAQCTVCAVYSVRSVQYAQCTVSPVCSVASMQCSQYAVCSVQCHTGPIIRYGTGHWTLFFPIGICQNADCGVLLVATGGRRRCNCVGEAGCRERRNVGLDDATREWMVWPMDQSARLSVRQSIDPCALR